MKAVKAEITGKISKKANQHIGRIMSTLELGQSAGAISEQIKQSIKKELWNMFDDLIEIIGPLLEDK